LANFFENKLLESILNGRGHDQVNNILKEQKTVELDLLIMGFHHSCIRNKRIDPSHHEPRWIQAMAFAEDKKARDKLENLFLSNPRFKGDVLLALWHHDPSKAIFWLRRIKSFDPLFTTLRFASSPFTKSLSLELGCGEKDIFEYILLTDEENKIDYLNELVEKVMITEVEMQPGRSSEQELSRIREERRKIIQSKQLTTEQADQLFLNLWKANIRPSMNASKELTARAPEHVINCYRDEDTGFHYKYIFEMQHLFLLIPQVSEKVADKINFLYETLPFWIKNRNHNYQILQEYMLNRDRKRVINDWKNLFSEDMKLGKPKNFVRGNWGGRPEGFAFRPTEKELLEGLALIGNDIDMEFLISMVNHYFDSIRKKVQEKMKEKVA